MRYNIYTALVLVAIFVVGIALGIVLHGTVNSRYQNCPTCHGTGRIAIEE
jgi:hypothetical protein